MRSRRVVVAGGLIVLTILAGVVTSRVFRHDSRIEAALDTLPGQTLVANFTDWSAVRDQLGPGTTSGSPERVRSRLFTRAYDRDFSTTSVLGVFDEDMATTYGWTVLDSEWEMYGQSRDGSVDVLRLPDGFDFAAATSALTKLGYAQPDGHGVRTADAQALTAIAPGLTPQLTAIAVLPDEHLVVTSDAAAYAGRAVDTIDGRVDSVYDEDGVAEMAAALADTAVSALMDVGDYSCEAAGFGEADPAQQALARRRIKAAGGVSATRGLTLAIDVHSALTVVMTFASPAQARSELAVRVSLATGEAPDQGGTFDERFRVSRADVVGREVVLVLERRSSDAQLLRDLGRGGLLFASC